MTGRASASKHSEIHQKLMEVWHSGTGLMRHQYRLCAHNGAGNCCCGRDDRAAIHNDGVRLP